MRMLDNVLQMGEGYVLDFSHKTMAEFFEDELNININDSKYRVEGTSKAKRLRFFIRNEDPRLVVSTLKALWKYKTQPVFDSYINDYVVQDFGERKEEYFAFISRIEGFANIPSTSAIAAFQNEETLSELVASINRDINANKPATALDRLHTYCVKKLKFLITQYGGDYKKDEPLHSLMGKYIKLLNSSKCLNDMSIRILKSSISILEKFNNVRNHASLAHDNTIVNQEEAIYIFESVSATLKFIRSIEKDKLA